MHMTISGMERNDAGYRIVHASMLLCKSYTIHAVLAANQVPSDVKQNVWLGVARIVTIYVTECGHVIL